MVHSGWISGENLWQWRQSARQDTYDYICNLQEAEGYLRDLDWLLTAVTGMDRLALKLEIYRTRPAIALERSLSELSFLWQRRLQENVPVQYLLGRACWRNFMLTVAPGVLIPRPETELLIDLAMGAFPRTDHDSAHWVDLGTGSGAIALALAKNFPSAMIHSVDKSVTALEIAKQNAKQLGLMDRVQFYEGNWLEPIAHLKGKISGVVSNPPYIPSALIPTLQAEVFKHEPHLALDGGMDGLEHIRKIIDQSPYYLNSGGVLIFEMMMGQADIVSSTLRYHGSYHNIQIHSDLAGIKRFAQAYRI